LQAVGCSLVSLMSIMALPQRGPGADSITSARRLTPLGHSSIATPGVVLGKLRQRHTLPLYVLSLSMLQLSGDHAHTANNINQIEAVQRRAARSVMNDWSRPHSQSGRSSSSKGSPTLMMQQLGWNTLEVRRNQARAVMMYRIVNGLIAIPASLYLTPKHSEYKRTWL